MSAIGLPPGTGNFIISAQADYRHGTLFFARQQSPALAALEWESRLKPMMPWSSLILMGAGGAALLALALALLA